LGWYLLSFVYLANDEEVINLVQNIELGEQWLEEVLTIISIKDEADRIEKRTQDT